MKWKEAKCINSCGRARSHSFSLRSNYTKNEKNRNSIAEFSRKMLVLKHVRASWCELHWCFAFHMWNRRRWLHISPLTDHKGTWFPPRSFWEYSLRGRPVPCHEDTQASRWGGPCVRNGSHVRHHLGSGPSSPCRTFGWRGPGRHLDCNLSGDSEPRTNPLPNSSPTNTETVSVDLFKLQNLG